MEEGTPSINLYGRTGPFGDALYFGLRDFKETLIDRVSMKDDLAYQALDERSSGATLVEATREALEVWTPDDEALIREAADSWPEAGGEIAEMDRKLIIERRLRQINRYLEAALEMMTASQDVWAARTERLRRALGALTWPYFFVAYTSLQATSPDEKEASADRKVTWLPPVEYLQGSSSTSKVAQAPEAKRGPLHQFLYPSVSHALEGPSSLTEKKEFGIEDWIEAWLQVGQQPLKVGQDTAILGEEKRKARDIGHVQGIRSHDYQVTYEGALLQSEDRKESRFADCVYANRSTFQIPIAEDGNLLDSLADSNEGAEKSDEEIAGVLFICSPIRLGEVFPSMQEPSQSKWVSEMIRAWTTSRGKQVGLRLKEQYAQLVGELVEEIRYRTERKIEREAAEQKALAYAGIKHSLENAIDKTEGAEKWELEKWCLEAAKGIIDESWSPTSVGSWSSCRSTLEKVFESMHPPDLHIEENHVLEEEGNDVAFDPRLLAVLTETCRNRHKHFHYEDEDGPVYIQVTLDERLNSAKIEYESPCSRKDFRSIAELLSTGKDKWKGVEFIAHFAESIASESTAAWCFVDREEKSDLRQVPLGRQSAGAARVQAPGWLVEKFIADDTFGSVRDLTMRFRAEIPDPLC